jgi:hypothetical protein
MSEIGMIRRWLTSFNKSVKEEKFSEHRKMKKQNETGKLLVLMSHPSRYLWSKSKSNRAIPEIQNLHSSSNMEISRKYQRTSSAETIHLHLKLNSGCPAEQNSSE